MALVRQGTVGWGGHQNVALASIVSYKNLPPRSMNRTDYLNLLIKSMPTKYLSSNMQSHVTSYPLDLLKTS